MRGTHVLPRTSPCLWEVEVSPPCLGLSAGPRFSADSPGWGGEGGACELEPDSGVRVEAQESTFPPRSRRGGGCWGDSMLRATV